MYEVRQETLDNAHKPFDIVTDKDGCAGFIQEVSVNDGQSSPEHQISYAVNWMTGSNRKHAWFNHDELTFHCNLFVKIAESACHPMGKGSASVQSLFNSINR